MEPENMQAQSTFDRVLSGIDGLPDVRSTKPSTIQSVIPLMRDVQTWVVQTYQDPERGFTVFLQVVDAEGRARFVLPNKVALAIYRQRQALADRSTPASRARKKRSRQTKKQREEKARRREAWAARHTTTRLVIEA